MGTGKQLIFSGTGYPGTIDTWRFIQAAFSEAFTGVAAVMGDKVILTGINPIDGGNNRTMGYVSYGGEILLFESGTYQDNVTIIETTVSAEYDKDTNNDGVRDIAPVMKTRYMRFGTDGVTTFPFAYLLRLQTMLQLSQFTLPAGIVIDPNYLQLTAAMVVKLAGIEAGAQVNVKPNWNAATGAANEILNKPNVLTVLARGTVLIGDVSASNNNGEYTITFASVGTSNYQVHLTFESTSAAAAPQTATLMYSVFSKTATSFSMHLSETGNYTQNLRIAYTLTPLP